MTGKPLPNRMGFDALQTHADGARYLSPTSEVGRCRGLILAWGEAGMNPFMPESFENARNPWVEVGMHILSGAKDKAVEAVDKVTSTVSSAGKKLLGKIGL